MLVVRFRQLLANLMLWPKNATSVGFRPKVDQSHRFNSLGANLVEVANSVGFLPQVTVELHDPLLPMAHLRRELSDFALSKLEPQLSEVLLATL